MVRTSMQLPLAPQNGVQRVVVITATTPGGAVAVFHVLQGGMWYRNGKCNGAWQEAVYLASVKLSGYSADKVNKTITLLRKSGFVVEVSE